MPICSRSKRLEAVWAYPFILLSMFSPFLFYGKMVDMNIINIYENYNYYFNSDFKHLFKLCSKAASENGYKLYLIGGLVRDLLLNQPSLDIDITIEGDAIEFARLLEKENKAKILSVHPKFGTVKVEIQGMKIDFASTRNELYPKKGHLPHVSEIGCSLEKDVLRRDFTINSLAMSLNQNNFADLLDYVGGYEDLKSKKIKILHDKSFVDDPTRILRALKYSARFGFELDENTFNLQEEYLENVNYDMCNKRIKNEIKKTFGQSPEISQIAFEKFVEQEIYKLITPKKVKIYNPKNLIKKYNPKHNWLVYFGLISVFEDDKLLDKLELTNAEKNVVLNAKKFINSSFENDFLLYKAFCNQHIETLLILAVLGKEKEVIHYMDNLKKIKLSITGDDLLKLGLKPSKAFGEIFDFILKEKLKNPHLKKDEEIELIKKHFN